MTDKQPITEEITGLHGICKIPNHSKIIVNTNTKEECESIIQQILLGQKALEELSKLKLEFIERVDTANKIIAEKIDEIKKLKQDFEGFRSFVKEEFNYT